jgi:RNA 2',3'-cyclic 3'-phosphodiesterase
MRVTESLRGRHPMARWTPPEQLHLTMVFLGDVQADEVPRIDAAVAAIARGWPAFEVTMGVGDGFIGRRRGGGVAWLRVADGYDDVAQLARSLDQAIGADAFARVPPRPHLTLARGVTEELLADLRAGSPRPDLGWTVDSVVLFRSHGDSSGSTYEELGRHRLGGG